jgi:hypothetical protein
MSKIIGRAVDEVFGLNREYLLRSGNPRRRASLSVAAALAARYRLRRRPSASQGELQPYDPYAIIRGCNRIALLPPALCRVTRMPAVMARGASTERRTNARASP